MGVPSKRFAVFLCLIILHHDLVIARSHYDLDMDASPRLRSPVDDDIADDYLPSNQTISTNELTVSSSKALGRGKRLLGLILFIVSLVVTVVATTIETIYDIKGCCGLGFAYLCSFEAEFKRKQCDIEKRSEEVDRRIQEAVKKKDNLECLSNVLEGFWTEIDRLVHLTEDMFKAISVETLNHLIMVEGNMTIEMQNINDTVKKEEENAKEIAKIDQSGLAMRISLQASSVALPTFVAIGQHAFKSFKINRFYKVLKSTQLKTVLKATPKAKELMGFTSGSAKMFIKGIAKSRFAGKAALATKGMKIIKFGGYFMSVLSIAMDVFSTVSLLLGCKKKVDQACESLKSLDEPAKNVTRLEKEIEDYENEIKICMVDKIVPQLRKVELHNALAQVKKNIENLSKETRSWDTSECADEIIPNALKMFKDTENHDYVLLKDELKSVIDNCLSRTNYAFECFTSRIRVNEKILEDCRAGTDDFEDILKKALKMEGTTIEKCKKNGEPYTPDKNYLKSLEDNSKEEGFLIPCKLNSDVFKNDVCKKKKKSSNSRRNSPTRKDGCDSYREDIRKVQSATEELLQCITKIESLYI